MSTVTTPTLDAIAAQLASIQQQLDTDAKAKAEAAAASLHGKLDALKSHVTSEISTTVARLEAAIPTRASAVVFAAGMVAGGIALLAALHLLHLVG